MPATVMFVMLRLQVPVFEMGNGFGVEQAPILWMTVAGKARSGGTSIEAAGVFPVTTSVMVGLFGSSLVITKLQDFDPSEAGVKRITKFKHESWLTVAGNGLLTREKSVQPRTALATWRLHAPILHTEIVFSAKAPEQTSPKSVDPVVVIFCCSPFPVA